MPSDPSAPSAALRLIPLPQLLQRGGELELSVLQPLADLQDAELVQGWIRLRHHGTALEVEGEASATLRCRCDRCLRPFLLPVRAQAHERLCLDPGGTPPGESGPNDRLASSAWLNDAGGLDPQAWLGEDPEERLDPQGVFDPEHWLFEQLSLQRPLVYHCGPDCPGPDRWSSAGGEPDRRWQALRQLLRSDGA
ncbi:MAG: YceD family protein [Synechococcaceae cyanobacterium]